MNSQPTIQPASPRPRHTWVPIRSMAARHRPRIAAHLLTLDARDRYLRFGQAATDEQVLRYVDTLNFERDEVFGIFNRRLLLIAMAHLAYLPDDSDPSTAEFGVSVIREVRGRGYGAHLFEHAMLHARNRNCERLFIHALTENTAMLKIALRAGATVERDGPESQARLKLPPDDLSSQVGEMVAQQIAELDYQFKAHAYRARDRLKTPSEVTAHTKSKKQKN